MKNNYFPNETAPRERYDYDISVTFLLRTINGRIFLGNLTE